VIVAVLIVYCVVGAVTWGCYGASHSGPNPPGWSDGDVITAAVACGVLWPGVLAVVVYRGARLALWGKE
jgi:hypothetical protein